VPQIQMILQSPQWQQAQIIVRSETSRQAPQMENVMSSEPEISQVQNIPQRQMKHISLPIANESQMLLRSKVRLSQVWLPESNSPKWPHYLLSMSFTKHQKSDSIAPSQIWDERRQKWKLLLFSPANWESWESINLASQIQHSIQMETSPEHI